MTVILMTHETEAPAMDVASATAERLGLVVVPKEQLEKRVAARLQVDERAVRGLIDGTATLLERLQTDARRLSRYLADETVRLAARDNVVIMAWGAVAQLRPIRHVMRVHVGVPAGSTARGDAHATADGRSTRAGASRESVIPAGLPRRALGTDCGCGEPYHLVLDTDRAALAHCVDEIARLAQRRGFQPTPASRAMLNSLLQQARRRSQAIAGPVSAVGEAGLHCETSRQPGIAPSDQAIAQIEEHLRGAPLVAAGDVL